jgi:hypothetical protein
MGRREDSKRCRVNFHPSFATTYQLAHLQPLTYHPFHIICLDISASEALIFKNEVHTGPVRGLDFNPKQQNLLASGAINAEVSESTLLSSYYLAVERLHSYIWTRPLTASSI